MFAIAGPRIWNSLPPLVCVSLLSEYVFVKHLKLHLLDLSVVQNRRQLKE